MTTASARTIWLLNKQQQHIEELDQLEVENYYKAHCCEMNQKMNGKTLFLTLNLIFVHNLLL